MASEPEEPNKARRGNGDRWVCPICGEEMLMSQAMRGFCEILPPRTECPLQPLRASPEK
jgi:hypothetical protein